MKTLWSEEQFQYDGAQLRSSFAAKRFALAGDSIVAWRGSCDISLENMVDGEDREANAEIRGADMVHFIVEVFNFDLLGVTALQRLLAAIAKDVVVKLSLEKLLISDLCREGDDLWIGKRKLSISVATVTPVSAVIHFAVDVSNEGTPVPTISLQDLKIDPKAFALALMESFQKEFLGIHRASEKVSHVD